MHSISVFAALAAAVYAQSATQTTYQASSITSSASTGTASASTNATSTQSGPVTYTVAVAKGGHSYSPDVVQAKVGDTVEFQFYPTNHSVARAAYGYPCVPYELVEGAGYVGFDSGFKPVDAVLDDPPSWSLLINDTDPVFYYCGAPNSCIGYGMVGVINPNASVSLAHQRQLAEESTFMLLPGEDWPSEGSIPSGVANTSASASPTTSNAPATVTADSSHSSHGLSGGAIAGIAIAAAVVLVAAGAAVWYCGRQSRVKAATPQAPAQEFYPGYAPVAGGMVTNKQGHMSTMSGYTMPPGYENQHQQGMRSPTMQTMSTIYDPRMGGHQSPPPHTMTSSTPTPAPAYGSNNIANMYTPGTHHVAPIEMDTSQGRASMEKPPGVERYS